MRLPTRVHGLLDYVLAALLIALPFVLHLESTTACGVLIAAGVAVAAYSLLTDYELGALRRLQVPVHLWIDGLLGVLLAVSPWLLGFDSQVWIPHVVMGAVAIATALLTDTIPGYERRQRG